MSAVGAAAPGLPQAPRPLLGVLLILSACSMFGVLDTTAKLVVATLPVLILLTVRYLVQAMAMGVWLLRPRRLHLFRPAHPRFQLLRGLLMVATSGLNFIGLQYLPVAETTAIVMLTPVLVTLLAVALLGERMSPWRWALVAGGLIGGLVIVRPGSALFGWAALFPLAAALCNAAFQVLTRQMSGLENPLTTHFYSGLIGTVGSLLALAMWPGAVVEAIGDVDLVLVAQLLLVGAMGTIGHLLLIHAFAQAPVSVLMPFTYASILFASLGGWLVFDHLPDEPALAGMALITACGAASVWLNARPRPAQELPTPVPQKPVPHTPVPGSPVAADTIGD